MISISQIRSPLFRRVTLIILIPVIINMVIVCGTVYGIVEYAQDAVNAWGEAWKSSTRRNKT